MKARTQLLFVIFAFAAACLGPASVAFAYNQTNLVITPNDGYGNCGYCHRPGGLSSNYGPHGGWSKSSDGCKLCHTIHNLPADNKLLRGATMLASCRACHDGTGGRGVYGLIANRGVAVGGEHSIENTSVVPGGSESGESAPMAFGGPNGTLTCVDCHSPHGNDVVVPFLGERQREPALGLQNIHVSSRLLKRRPGGATVPVAEYGSDWCLACHKGRVSGGAAVHNHPVESSATVAVPYNYRELGIIGPGPYPTSTTVLGAAGINTIAQGYNRAYLMPYPRTGAQAGHLPICQQCHEDTRDVGKLTADGMQAIPSTSNVLAGDGRSDLANPRFMNFPHETSGYRLLVEADTSSTSDDLCMNCHPPAALP